MSGVTDFLLARIAEDEAAAEFEHDDTCGLIAHPNLSGCDCRRERRRRSLAECEAKRRIAERLGGCADCGWDPPCDDCTTLGILASVYADHLDYRQEWRP